MIAPGNRPPHIAIATVGGIQVLGHETPGESSGAEDNHIKRFAHTQSLHDSATSAQACRSVNVSGGVVSTSSHALWHGTKTAESRTIAILSMAVAVVWATG